MWSLDTSVTVCVKLHIAAILWISSTKNDCYLSVQYVQVYWFTFSQYSRKKKNLQKEDFFFLLHFSSLINYYIYS